MSRDHAIKRFNQAAARSGGVDCARWPLYLCMVFRTIALAPLRFAQRRQERRSPNPPLAEDPVFVLGHWRSGTTYLQQLLAADPRHTTPTLFTSLFSDVSVVGRGLQRPLDAVAAALGLPHSIQRRQLRLGLPAEGDIGLCLALFSAHSYSWGHIFPRAFEQWMDSHVFHLTPEAARGWLDDYDTLMRRVSALAGGSRVVMKSPGDTGRVPWLLRQYPKAKFAYIHRDPIAVYHSTRYLWSVIRREFGLQAISDGEVHRVAVQTYTRLLQRYLRDRARVPKGQLAELRYEALRRDGPGTVGRLYEQLRLGTVPEEVHSELRINTPHIPTHYDTASALERELREAWSFAFQAWPEEPS